MPDHEALVLVVHGIGEQKKGEALKYTVEEFLPLIRKRLDPDVIVRSRPLDSPGPDDVTFRFRAPASPEIAHELRDSYKLRCSEVFWAESFYPPALGSLILGLLRGLRQRFSERGNREMNALKFIWLLIWEAVGELTLDLIKILISPIVAALVCIVLLCQIFIQLGRLVPAPFDLPWVILRWALPETTKGLLKAFLRDAQGNLLDLLSQYQSILARTFVIVLSPLIVVLALLLWILESPLPQAAIPQALRGFHRALVNFVTYGWGDMWLYLYEPWEASRIRTKFEDEFKSMTRRLDKKKMPSLDAVMVIAHSMGSTVAYEAMTGDLLAEEIAKFEPAGAPKLYFVSIGSALNLCWDAAPEEERGRLNRSLSPAVDWLNIWAEYDPFAGEPLRLPALAYRGRQSAWSPGFTVPLSQRKVVNQMDLFSDHSAYWNNAEEVIAPLLDLLTAQSLSSHLVLDAGARRDRVRILSLFKAIAYLIGPALLAASLWETSLTIDKLDWVPKAVEWVGDKLASEALDVVIDIVNCLADEIGDWIRPLVDGIDWLLQRLGDGAGWIGDRMPEWLKDAWRWLGDRTEWRRDIWDWFYPEHADVAKSIALGIESGLAAWLLYSTLVKWAWDSWDRSRKYFVRGVPKATADG